MTPTPRSTRRQVVKTTATAAWAAPVIIAASAAPAYAGSGAPAVTTSDVEGVGDDASVVTATMTFTNNGTAAATSLTVPVNLRLINGGFINSITDVTSGWTVSAGVSSGQGGWDYTFIRAAGIATGAANAQTLTFRFPASGIGTITVSAPITSPAGANTGAVGPYTSTADFPVR